MKNKLFRGKKVNKSLFNKAFAELRKLGYTAKQNFSCCRSCAWGELTEEEAKKAVFFSMQSTKHLNEEGTVYLSWSGDGNEIKSIFEKHNCKVEWEGTPDKSIFIEVPMIDN